MTAVASHRFSVAPMMECTDRHDRFLLRLITRRALLYTEMITTGALIHGDRTRLLAYDPREQPVALQLGGSTPDDMAICAKMGEDAGYSEVNINVGCPSDRVQSGRFGACLMAEPELVATCVNQIINTIDLPVTIKTRIGIDDRDSEEALLDFVDIVAAAGCQTIIVHARKAWLTGLSPKENRNVPPLRYDVVERLKAARPRLTIVLNGGINDITTAQRHLQIVDGVMMGRSAYANPYILSTVDQQIFNDNTTPLTRHEVIESFSPYIEQQLVAGVTLGRITRHILGLFLGCAGARSWRRHISEHAYRADANADVVRDALEKVNQATPHHPLHRVAASG